MTEPDHSLKQTPLFAFHRENGGRFVDFGGWQMPVQYTSILEEHKAVRRAAGLFDVSHMGEIAVTGPEAEAFLDQLLTNRIEKIPAGKAVYSPMCDESGGAIDDLIVYRRGGEDFLLCVNASNTAKDFAWIRERAASFQCEVTDISEDWALLALQGPKAEPILARIEGAPDLAAIKPFTFVSANLLGAPCLVARTGYTGEKGFEIFIPSEKADAIARAILEAGQPEGLLLTGLGARDSLRLEAGYPLYGHELSERITPLQAGLGWTVKFDKPRDFVGKDALRKQKERGLESVVVFFRTGHRRIVRQGAAVFDGDRRVGEVLSGSLSPCLNEAIDSALVEKAEAKSPTLEADLRGTRQRLVIVRPPLYSSSHSTQKTP